jgi:membrane protease YdiL (CAAX protease family)
MDTGTAVQTKAETQPQKHQTSKSILTKIGNKDWLLLLLIQIFAFALQFILGVLIGIFYAIQHKRPDVNLFKSIVANPAVIMIPTFIAELIAFAIARKMLNKKIGEHLQKPAVSAKFVFVGGVIALGASHVGSLVVSLFQMLLSPTGFHLNMPVLLSTSDPNLLILGIVNLCLFAPILEEILFRGFISKSLLPYGSAFAIVSSAILFGIMHGNLVQAIPTILLGLVLGYIRVQANSVIPTILIHSVNNILAVISMLLPENNVTVAISVTITFLLIAAAVVLLVINRKQLTFAKGRVETQMMSTKQKAVVFYFRSVCFYVLLALFIFHTIILSAAKG